ncbi:unnamed protein product [Ascophyllum nodosum]
MEGLRRNIAGSLIALACGRSVEAFAVGGGVRSIVRNARFPGTPMASVVGRRTAEEVQFFADFRSSGVRRTAGVRMLAGMDFATCSDEDFRNYIVGWTFVWSGIIPYTFIAAKNVLGEVVTAKALPAVSKGEDSTISNQSLLLYKDPIKLIDVVNIVGRFQTYEEVQTAKTKKGLASDYLFRDTFKESLRKRKFKEWPKGPDGQLALQDAFGSDIKAMTRTIAKRPLSESAMNAVFDTFAGSPLSIVADRHETAKKGSAPAFKVENQLEKWRKDSTFDVKGFEQGLLVGRLLFLFTIVTVIALELAGYGVFFIEPITTRYGNPLSFLGF